MLQTAEIGVIAGGFFGQQGVQRVVKIVAPLRVQRVTAALGGVQNFAIVHVAFGDEHNSPAGSRFQFFHGDFQFGQKMNCAEIADTIDGVQAQSVDAKFFEPIEGIGNKKIAHRAAMRAVEIQRRTPRGAVTVREVRAEFAEVISLRAKMVVDHIENDGQSANVSGIDEPLQAQRPAIRILRREDVDAVVAPVSRARKLGHRHDFDGGDPQLRKFVEVRDHAIESAFRSVGADVQLVQHSGLQT